VLKGKQTGNQEAVSVIKAKADERASNIRAIVDDIRAHGVTTIRGMAQELEARHVLMPRGGIEWHPTTVARLLERLTA
jgi:hypothetical protein